MGATQQSGKVLAVNEGRKKRFRSKQERRQIVEETLKPGASVSLVARAHDVNANQVFKWRRLYREGRLDIAPSPSTANTLVAVRVCDAQPMVTPTRRRVKSQRAGIIDIDLGHARVRIEGAADPKCVRAALERLVG